METETMKHKSRLTIHAVPFGSGTLTAECGELLGNGHTGHYPPISRTSPDVHLCAVCAGVR